jgi:hypothetical protein
LAIFVVLPMSNSSLSAAEEKPSLSVALAADEAANLGIATLPANEVVYTPGQRGYGIVVGLDAIAQSDSEIATAEAAAKQSAAAVKRARELATGREAAMSRDALDLAERQAKADSAALALALAKATATFGRDAPWRDPGQHDAAVKSLAEGSTALVRATFPTGIPDGAGPTALRIAWRETDAWSSAIKIWLAPADPLIPGRSYFALVQADLVSGERVLVDMKIGPSQKGILVPEDAVLLSDNATWFYVAESGGTYVRHQIDTSHTMPGGYFLRDGVAPGAHIVVKGAGLLLARELNPSTAAEE